MLSTSRPQVWIVDDDINNRVTLGMVVAFEGYRFETFDCGEEALNALATRERSVLPDLVLLDHEMPGLNGLQVLERIRSESALSGLKVAMVTATAQQIRFTGADGR